MRRRKISDDPQEGEGGHGDQREGGTSTSTSTSMPNGNRKGSTVRVVKLHSVVWLCIGAAIGSGFGGPWMADVLDWIRGYRWNYLDRCILETPMPDGYGVDFCRHPADCNICSQVSQIDEISVDDMSVELFEAGYAYTSRPLVVRNATLHWDIMQVMDYDWLKQQYLSDPEEMDKKGEECWFNRYTTPELRNLRAVFKLPDERVRMKSGEPWYVGWSVCHENVAEEIFKLFERPVFLSPESTPPKKPWIFIGTPGPGAHFHVDNVDMSSWQVQLGGVKTWYLKPPPECRFTCPGQIQTTLYPGDIIVVNTNFWFHSTKVHGPHLSLSMVNEFD